MSVLEGIMNPAQADVMGAMDKGVARQDANIARQGAAQKRQAYGMAGDILGESLGGKIGALTKLDHDTGMALAESLGIPTNDKKRLENTIGTNVMVSTLWDAGDRENAISTLEKQIQYTEQHTGEEAVKLRAVHADMMQGGGETTNNFLTTGRALNPLNKPAKHSQATGKGMQGWSFNESTGQYSLDPAYQSFLDSDAGRLANKEMLGPKDVAGINDKVTNLVKESVAIRSAASDLEALSKDASQPAVIAAIFKFMKALDPTSAVRENEVGMIEGAEGAAQGMANMYNRLLGEGGMSTEGFAEIVRTAKTLSNSSIGSANDSVSKYTDVISDNLTGKQLKDLRARAPGMFEITERTKSLPPVNTQGWVLQVDASGNKAYVGPNGEIDEVQ
jgi:hypothetical protein